MLLARDANETLPAPVDVVLNVTFAPTFIDVIVGSVIVSAVACGTI
jgi:hypothetical protein